MKSFSQTQSEMRFNSIHHCIENHFTGAALLTSIKANHVSVSIALQEKLQ